MEGREGFSEMGRGWGVWLQVREGVVEDGMVSVNEERKGWEKGWESRVR